MGLTMHQVGATICGISFKPEPTSLASLQLLFLVDSIACSSARVIPGAHFAYSAIWAKGTQSVDLVPLSYRQKHMFGTSFLL